MKVSHQYRLLLCVALLCAMLLTVLPSVTAAETTTAPAPGNNLDAHSYDYNFASVVTSYLVDNGNGTFTRVSYTGKDVAVEIYDADFQFVSGQRFAMELPLFGGFYCGSDSNYLIFGQNNPDEDDSTEVIRVVRYSKDWTRKSQASVYGANTVIPFDAGSLRCAEYNGYLYVRTSHEMYKSSDGYNHQANMTFNIRLSDMVVTQNLYSVSYQGNGYASHSFNQFILVDNGKLVALDHGDAYPRAVSVTRYKMAAGQDHFYSQRAEYVDAFPITGSIGDNYTGVEVGGFLASSTSYLTCGISVDQSNFTESTQQNVFVCATSKTNFTTSGNAIRYLTSYTEEDGVALSNVQFVQIGTDRFAVLWTETSTDFPSLRFAVVNGEGQLVGSIQTADGALSDCVPILSENRLIWYVNRGSAPVFMVMDLDNPGAMPHQHVYRYYIYDNPGWEYEGTLNAICVNCGAAGEPLSMPPLSQTDAYNIYELTVPDCLNSGRIKYSWKDAYMYGLPNVTYTKTLYALGHDLTYHEQIPATCSAVGILEHYACSRCGLYFEDSRGRNQMENVTIELDPDNHRYDDTTHLCVCGAMDPAYIIPAVKYDTASLSFESETLVNLYYTTEWISDIAEQGMLVYYEQPETVSAENADEVIIGSAEIDDRGRYHVQSNGIPAKMLGDQRYYVAYVKQSDGTYIYSEPCAYSPKQYAMNRLEKSTNQKMKALCVAMLNYGAAAQTYFDYRTEDLMNAELTAEQQAMVAVYSADLFTGAVKADENKSGQFAVADGFRKKSATVSFEGAFAINYYFTASLDASTDVTFYYWTAEAYSEAEVLTPENASGTTAMVLAEDGRYWAQIDTVAAKEMDHTYYVAAVYTDASGNSHCTGVVAYSISTYCMRNAASSTMGNLAQATALYGYHASEYFTN